MKPLKQNPLSSIQGAHWLFPPDGKHSPAAVNELIGQLTSSLGMGRLLATIMVARGLETPAAVRAFLNISADGLHDPLLLPDMALGVEMINNAIEHGDPILVHGDYDVDGVTSCALMQRALTALGGVVHTHLPHRLTDGYGLSKRAIDKASADGIKLLVTTDCGTGATEEIRYAHSLGLQVVVTDHHHPSRDPLEAGAKTVGDDAPPTPEINPHRAGSAYPFTELSGVGVAFKVIEALAAHRGIPPRAHWRFLDLVALGTVADVSPLIGENRILVKEGLEVIGKTKKVGLTALMRAAGLEPPVTCRQVAFMLAPRLNAAGRLAHPQEALDLLTTSDAAAAEIMAQQLCTHNRARQDEEAKTLRQALELIETQGLADDKVLLLAGLGWHPGVIGIVASRLVETFHRPVFMASQPIPGESEKTACVGSARSIPGFPLWDALYHCRKILLRFGGHDMAAGFSVEPEHVPQLRAALCELAAEWLDGVDGSPTIDVDAEVSALDLTVPAVEELDKLEPMGAGNPMPTVVVRDLKITEITKVGDTGKHLRLVLQEKNGLSLRTIWFGHGNVAESLTIGQTIDICLNPTVSIWKGRKSLELRLKDIATPTLIK